jgi:hypothetical protein
MSFTNRKVLVGFLLYKNAANFSAKIAIPAYKAYRKKCEPNAIKPISAQKGGIENDIRDLHLY